MASTVESPVTPVRQLGATRGQRRTPASRTKKPYSRQIAVDKESDFKENYKAEASPGFLKGMRTLVSRLWGTSLRTGVGAAAADSEGTQEPAKLTTDKAKIQTLSESTPGAGAIRSAQVRPNTAAANTFDRTPDVGRYSATVTERRSSRRGIVPETFAPSPFAYNKKLAAASPSVANLRDIE
ncbi:hypothetical protein GGI12_006335, partial [Dipsacomyces acuminosporus]